MAFKLLTIAFAATAAAAPTSSSPCQSAEFSLAMQVDGNYVSLNAIDNGSPGSVNIVAENPSEYPGTPGMPHLSHHYYLNLLILIQNLVYENGTTPNAQLNFNIDCTNEPLTNQTGVFHISVPDLGERYGASEAITASTEFTYPHFSVGSDGSVVPELTAASQWWYGEFSFLSSLCHRNRHERTMLILTYCSLQQDDRG